MVWKKDVTLKDNQSVRSYTPGFFHLAVTFAVPPLNERCVELQQNIQKQQEHITEVEQYILNAKKPIEHNIKEYQAYKQRLKAKLQEKRSKITDLEAKMEYVLCVMSDFSSSELTVSKIYINCETRECKILGADQKTIHTFYVPENKSLKLNTPGLKSEVLDIALQENILKNTALQKRVDRIKKLCVGCENLASEIQKTENNIIEYNHKLNLTSFRIENFKKKLPSKKQKLMALEDELAEIAAQEIKRHLMPAA